MSILSFYGLLALAVFSIAAAAKTLSLWKVGLVFLVNWILTSFAIAFIDKPFDGVATTLFDVASAMLCLGAFKAYKCDVAGKVGVLYIFSAFISLMYSFSGEYTSWVVVANALYIAQAMTILWEAISRFKNHTPRKKNVHFNGRDRRKSKKASPAKREQYA